MVPERTHSGSGRAVSRVLVAGAAGVLIGVVVTSATNATYGLGAGWAGSSALYIGWVWWTIGRLDPADTEAHATREDPGRTATDFLVIAASVASLGAVGLMLARGRSLHGWSQDVVAALAVLTVALSWVLIQTVYSLRYARIYYTEPVGGIDFNNPDEAPRYVDFAYLAFDLGQTFQVSDTALRTSELRGIVLRHTLLSYVFNSVVLATTINLVASLG